MKAQDQQQIIPQTCPVCDSSQKYLSYTPLEMKNIVHISCEKCSSNILAFLSRNDMGIMTVGIVTDLSLSEARKFIFTKSVSFDDVLVLHEMFLQHKLTTKDLL